MARYELDELEADEVYHSLVGRKIDLDSRAKSLEEKEGLPEAAAAVRSRIALYMPNGDGEAARPGLLRMFAPQRDLDAERRNAQAGEERAPDGGADLFGGGAETGGGIPAGQTEPAKGRRGRKKKGEPETPEPPANVPPPPADPIDVALDQLTGLSADLLKGDPTLEGELYRGYAVPATELLSQVNPNFDPEYLRNEISEVLRETTHNAHALGHFVQRHVDQIRAEREKPIGRREEAHGSSNEQTPIDGEPAGTPEPADQALSFAAPAPPANEAE